MRSKFWKAYRGQPAPLRLRQKLEPLRGRGFDQTHTPPSPVRTVSWPKWASLITMKRFDLVSADCSFTSQVHSAMQATCRAPDKRKNERLRSMGTSQA